MNVQTRREIRVGLVALALSGFVLALGIALRGPIDLADPQSFIRGAASPAYALAWTLILVGGVLNVYGFFGLYRYLTYQAESLIAFLAFLTRIAGVTIFLALAAFFAVNGPVVAQLYQQGNQEVIAVVNASFTGLGLALLAASAVAAIVGWLLFAVAMWRDGRLPKWIIALFALGLPLEAFPVALVTEVAGVVLLMVSGSFIAWRGWQESRAGP